MGGYPLALLAVGIAGIALRAAKGAFDNDLWWHLRLGYDFVQQGNLQPPAHWSPMATEKWVPTEPLPEIVAAIAHQWAGYNGVAWLYACVSMLVLLSIYVGNRAVGSPPAACISALVGIVGCTVSLTPRPQLVSFVLLPIVLRAWNRTSTDLAARWYLIPLTYGWSLCHGFWFIGVFYGFAEVAGLLLDRRVRIRQGLALGAIPLLSAAAVLLNPVGLGLFEAPFAVNGTRSYIVEWQHPHLDNLAVRAVALMIAAIVVLWMANRSQWSWRRVILLMTAAFWLWYAWRTVALASIVAAPLLAEGLEALLLRSAARGEAPVQVRSRTERRFIAGWLAACMVVLAALVPALTEKPEGNTPVDRALDTLPAGTVVFNDYDIGGWMTWRHPDLGQVIDGLITPYSPRYVGDFFRTREAKPGWREFLHRTGAPVALLLTDSHLLKALENSGWTVWTRYQDYVLLEEPGSR